MKNNQKNRPNDSMMDGELAELHVREKHGAEPLTEKDKRTAE